MGILRIKYFNKDGKFRYFYMSEDGKEWGGVNYKNDFLPPQIKLFNINEMSAQDIIDWSKDEENN